MTNRTPAAVVVIFLLVPMLARAQQAVLRGHAANPDVSVRLMAPVGSVRVIGWARDSVELTGTVPNGSRVEFSSPVGPARGMKMYVELPSDRVANEGKLVLRVPAAARVWLKTGSADIDVTGVTGGLDLNVVGGSITVHGTPRELRAESMDGSVTIDGTPAWLRAKTATGDITMNGGGEDLGASTISGAIRSSGGAVERIKLESTTGAITFANGLARAAEIEIDTHSGPVELELPRMGDVEMDLATITGRIENGWSRIRPVSGREGRGMTLTTSPGMTSARLKVRSFKGPIRVRAR
jgi:hypothetical protein